MVKLALLVLKLVGLFLVAFIIQGLLRSGLRVLGGTAGKPRIHIRFSGHEFHQRWHSGGE